MKRSWKVLRTHHAHADSTRRWDRAYQLLLEWAGAPGPSPTPNPGGVPMRIAIYVRVSTQRQAQTQTIDQQLDRLRRVAADRRWQLPEDHVFRDDGYSGASLRRPGLDRLRDLAALAKLDRILITDPDRLARNYVHQVLLLEELQRHGCRVEFTDRPLSDDPQDQLLLQIRGAVAEYERTLIAERTRRGRLHKLQSGPDAAVDPAAVWLPGRPGPPARPRRRADRPDRGRAGRRDCSDWYADEGRSFMAVVQRLHDLGVRSPSGREYWGMATDPGHPVEPDLHGHDLRQPHPRAAGPGPPLGHPPHRPAPRLAGAAAAGGVDRRGDGPGDRDPRAVRPGAGQDRHEPLVRPAEQHGDGLPAAGAGQLRVVPVGVPGPADDADGEDLLHLHGEEPPGAAAARLHLPARSSSPRASSTSWSWSDLADLLQTPGSGGEGVAPGGGRVLVCRRNCRPAGRTCGGGGRAWPSRSSG